MSGLLSINLPQIIQPYRHCRNNLLPDAAFHGELHAALNHTLAFRGAEVFRRSNALGFTRASGTNTVWQWRFTAGHGQTRLQVIGIAGLAHTSATTPAIQVSIQKVGGAGQTITIYGGTTATAPADAPSEWSPFEHTFDIDPGGTYECSAATIDHGAFISLMARQLGAVEIDDSVNYYSEHEPVGTGPIFDVDQQHLVQGSGGIIRANRGLVANWCLYDGAARTRANATWVNLIDNSSASPPTSTSPGYRFSTTSHNTVSRTTVPVSLAVYANATGGNGTVTLRDTSGTDAVTVTVNNATPQWFTGTGTIAVSSGLKLDPGFYSAGGGVTVNVYAISLWEGE